MTSVFVDVCSFFQVNKSIESSSQEREYKLRQ